MAVDMFLKIDGIEGESTDNRHKGTIEISSFSWGVSNTSTRGGGGGGGAGKVNFQDLSFMSRVSKASPVLFLACCKGNHIPKATLFVRKAGGEQQDYFVRVLLEEVLVSSYQTGGSSGEDSPTESFSLNYTKIEYDYKSQNADGVGVLIGAFWDLARNRGGLVTP